MREVWAFQLIKSLKKKETRRLKRFLAASYHTQQRELSKLLLILLKHPDKTTLPFSQLQLYGLIYDDAKEQDEAFRKKKVLNIISDLAKRIEEFIAIEQLKNDRLKQRQYLAEFLSKRGSKNTFELSISKWKRLTAHQKSTFTKHVNHYQSEMVHFESLHTDRLKVKTTKQFLTRMNQHLSYAHWIGKLSNLCNRLYRSPILEEDENLQEEIRTTLVEIDPLIKSNKDLPSIRMFRYLIIMGRAFGQLNLFKTSQQFFRINLDKFETDDQANFLHYFINYCDTSYNRGYDHFLLHSFNLSAWGEETGILTEREEMSDASFINTGLNQINLGKDAAIIENHIQTYKPYLPKKYQADAEHMVRAYFAFNNSQLDDVLTILTQIEGKDSKYMVRIKSLEIRIFYQKYIEGNYKKQALYFRLNAFRKYFVKNTLKLSYQRKSSYLRLARFIEDMLCFYTSSKKGTPAFLHALELKLGEEPPQCRNWVHEQLQQIKQALNKIEASSKD